MSVNPGFAGQAFLPYVVDKARRLQTMIQNRRLSVTIAMDGGVDLENVNQVVSAGVELCVAGSAVFGSDDPVSSMIEMRRRSEVTVA
jgi:ribulose-phosphate 3-epimerase